MAHSEAAWDFEYFTYEDHGWLQSGLRIYTDINGDALSTRVDVSLVLFSHLTIMIVEETAAGTQVDSITAPASLNRLEVIGGPNPDVMEMDEILLGSNTRVWFFGGAGNDTLLNADQMQGEAGSDRITGPGPNTGIVTAWGGSGNDVIRDCVISYGGAGNDVIHTADWWHYAYANGDAGVDWLIGNSPNDRMYGGAGNDFLFGGHGSDQLWGNAGVDFLHGGDGDDTLDPGYQMFGYSPPETLTGAGGRDLFHRYIVFGQLDEHIDDYNFFEGDREEFHVVGPWWYGGINLNPLGF
ncbi:MAG: calcium-binding protein [Pirellulaceae bacterium]